MPRQPLPCGTNGAYQRHIAHGEDPCEDCLDAHAEYMHQWRRGDIPARSRRQPVLTKGCA